MNYHEPNFWYKDLKKYACKKHLAVTKLFDKVAFIAIVVCLLLIFVN